MNSNLRWNEIELDYDPRKKILPQLPKIIREPEMTSFESAFLCGILKRFSPKKILEVGIGGGGTTAIILQCMVGMGNPFEIHSVDISERFYRDSSFPSGYLGTEADKLLKDKCQYNHFFHLGNIASYYQEEIGDDVDCLILDTAHKSPGEILDFITILPMLKNGCVVILHDVILSHSSRLIKKDKYATSVLFSAVSGEKYMNTDNARKQGLPNIAAFVVTEETREKIMDCFLGLLVPWGYMCSRQQIDEYRRCIEKYYAPSFLEFYDAAVSMNEDTVITTHAKIAFPFQMIPRNCRIILYGAGKVGKIFREQLSKKTDINVVKWVDRNYESIESYLKVDSVESMFGETYDKVVIAIMSQELAQEIKNQLIDMGVDESKIVWRTPKQK